MVTRIERNKTPAEAGTEQGNTTEEAAPADPIGETLDNLASQGSSEQPEPAPGPGPKPIADDLDADVLDALLAAQTFAEAGMWWLTPAEFQALWGEKKLKAAAKPLAEIMRRHGWNKLEMEKKWGPYIALAIAVGPSAVVTVKQYKAATLTPRAAPAPAAQEGGADGT